MFNNALLEKLECCPIIAAVREKSFNDALTSPVEVIFHLDFNILTAQSCIELAHKAGKIIFVHIDLAKGIGRDKCGIDFLKSIGVDGIISTKGQLLRYANEISLLTVQRFFVLDSQGMLSIYEQLLGFMPDFTEIMPGVIPKAIDNFANKQARVIAGGLIETKSEVTNALSHGAIAVSTGKKELWYI